MIDSKGKNLVFIICQPSSGSTLLQKILINHSGIFGVPEPWLMLHPLYAFKEKGLAAVYSNTIAQKQLTGFVKRIDSTCQAYYDAVSLMTTDLYNKLLKYSGKKLFLDKTPRYYLIIPELIRTYPKAKYIFLIRNPLSVLQSILNIIPRSGWVKNAEQNTIDLIEAPRMILDGIKIAPMNYVVHYEDFVNDNIPELIKLLNFLELEMEKGIGTYEVDGQKWGDNSGNINKFNRPTPTSPDKWITKVDTIEKKNLTIGYLYCLGKKIMSELGYDFNKSITLLEEINLDKQHEKSILWNHIVNVN